MRIINKFKEDISMNITKHNSPNKYNGRNGWKPDMIVCHITEGSFAGAVSWLCNPQSKASSHFVVAKDGRIAQLVDLTDGSWCNGTSTDPNSKVFYGKSTLKAVQDRKTNANFYTVTIEHEGVWSQGKGALTPAQLAATIELIKHIRVEVKKIYGIDIPLNREHIVGHYQINPITKPNCPGVNYQFDEIISALKGESTSNNTSSGSSTTSKVLYRVQVGAYSQKSNADAQAAKLKAKGYDTMIVIAGGLYKVQVGAFGQKSNADAMAKRLKTDGFDCFITTEAGTPAGITPATPPAPTLKVGAKVKITGDKYSTGQIIPQWVKSSTHVVSQINGDRVLLGANGGIASWLNKNDITVIE
jgi:N-acetyl-anhydromuramyl-L-alanine amidase AmpD